MCFVLIAFIDTVHECAVISDFCVFLHTGVELVLLAVWLFTVFCGLLFSSEKGATFSAELLDLVREMFPAVFCSQTGGLRRKGEQERSITGKV